MVSNDQYCVGCQEFAKIKERKGMETVRRTHAISLGNDADFLEVIPPIARNTADCESDLSEDSDSLETTTANTRNATPATVTTTTTTTTTPSTTTTTTVTAVAADNIGTDAARPRTRW